MSERFAEAVEAKDVRHDMCVLGDFVRIYCDGNHDDRERSRFESDAVTLGVYGRKRYTLCDECADHLRYGEQRRAYCPMDPKPFCSHCESHCYRPSEAEWQRHMMRYSGPRSWRHGHAIDGIRHAIAGKRAEREYERERTAEAATETTD